ncbi:7 transmembrane receptor [Ancylostoma ceylanicum]|uniref:7 transmembrane receptor n=1 Tax=Ancylostoma ceylanicum TaxID=53326 RepID=A0A0D6M304_9BILA|nr:7 transmembrane receptor [Ancylostoma ceylanicum]
MKAGFALRLPVRSQLTGQPIPTGLFYEARLRAPFADSLLGQRTSMARPIGLAAPSEEESSPVTLPFRNTQLFHLVMQVLSSPAENASSSHVLSPAGNGSEFPYGNESRMVAIITVGAVFAIVTFTGNLMVRDFSSAHLVFTYQKPCARVIPPHSYSRLIKRAAGVMDEILAIVVKMDLLRWVYEILEVMVSFKIDKQLQTISNYFLFSLAVADIAIGMISIPLWTYYTAMRSWGIGYTMCQFWLCVDYLMSNASVLNLLLISFDRYFSVTRPLSYRPRRTTRKALIMIACTYIISVILWPPWIISWPYIEGKFTVEPGTCVVQFLETNPYVTVGTAVAAFYLPVTIMIVLYSRVYWETRRRRRDFGKLQAGSQFPRRSIRRDTSTNSFVKNSERSSMRKSAWSSSATETKSNRSRNRLAWLRICSARSHSSSEDSSEVQVVNMDDTSLSSSLYAGKRKNTSPPLSPIPANDETVSGETQTENSPRSGSMRFRTRPTDRPAYDTYTVLIELKDEGARPSVRLSNCDTSANDRKSEKERKKNERKQESKAAKTLSAILAAFIVTWTPYNGSGTRIAEYSSANSAPNVRTSPGTRTFDGNKPRPLVSP